MSTVKAMIFICLMAHGLGLKASSSCFSARRLLEIVNQRFSDAMSTGDMVKLRSLDGSTYTTHFLGEVFDTKTKKLYSLFFDPENLEVHYLLSDRISYLKGGSLRTIIDNSPLPPLVKQVGDSCAVYAMRGCLSQLSLIHGNLILPSGKSLFSDLDGVTQQLFKRLIHENSASGAEQIQKMRSLLNEFGIGHRIDFSNSGVTPSAVLAHLEKGKPTIVMFPQATVKGTISVASDSAVTITHGLRSGISSSNEAIYHAVVMTSTFTDNKGLRYYVFYDSGTGGIHLWSEAEILNSSGSKILYLLVDL
ncbi:MAG: hypothetical protein HOE90_04350 [Bacteriovoracaceae bacterium]|nr:hypothetical protein [Bacteriovoracaceae bacterium]